MLIFQIETRESNAQKVIMLKTATATKTSKNHSDISILHTFISSIIHTRKLLKYWIRENKVSALMEFINKQSNIMGCCGRE